MRVTFVLPHADMSGGFRVIATYAQRLKDRGHDVTVVSTPPPPPDLRGIARTLIKEHRLPRFGASPSHLDHVDVDHRILERCRPVTDQDVPDADVVIATWWETAEWVWKLSPAKGAKAYFIQGYETWLGNADRVEATWRLPMQKIVISKWLSQMAADHYGDRAALIVPNSVDFGRFHAPPREKQPTPTAGLVHSTHPCKGLDVALKALDLIAKEVPDLRVVSFGHRPMENEMPLPACATFTESPPQERIKDLYAQCDAWICASRNEGFNLPMLEAMACRCPVVSTRTGASMDLIEDGVSGYVVEIDDAAALADRVVRVLRTKPEQWKAMSEAAYASARRFTWDQATELFEAALVTAIERQSADGRAEIARRAIPVSAVK